MVVTWAAMHFTETKECTQCLPTISQRQKCTLSAFQMLHRGNSVHSMPSNYYRDKSMHLVTSNSFSPQMGV